jgi:hypothetical protein
MGVTITAHMWNTFGLPGSFSALLFIFAHCYLIFFSLEYFLCFQRLGGIKPWPSMLKALVLKQAGSSTNFFVCNPNLHSSEARFVIVEILSSLHSLHHNFDPILSFQNYFSNHHPLQSSCYNLGLMESDHWVVPGSSKQKLQQTVKLWTN